MVTESKNSIFIEKTLKEQIIEKMISKQLEPDKKVALHTTFCIEHALQVTCRTHNCFASRSLKYIQLSSPIHQ